MKPRIRNMTTTGMAALAVIGLGIIIAAVVIESVAGLAERAALAVRR